MEPKEKAQELVTKFTKVVPDDFGGMDKELAQKCALISVNEIMTNGLLENQPKFNVMRGDAPSPTHTDYWSKVGQEIYKL